jgi:hypothetical protein
MFKPVDITGQKFNRLTAVRKVDGGKWLFHCECGKEKTIDRSHVKSGHTRSCGCLHMERCKTGLNRLRHGDAKPGEVKRIHSIWRGMLKRCDINSVAAKSYADRGITVCEEWREYLVFRDWAYSAGYRDELTIDRIDNDGPYAPWNCRWITMSEQARNRRNSHIIEYNGEKGCIAYWAERYGMNQARLQARITRLGWDIERALTTQVDKRYARNHFERRPG